MERPVIYTYEDAAVFVRDFVEYLKANDSSFSLRRLARDAEIKSHAHILQVIEGKTPLNTVLAHKLSRGLALDRFEHAYFLGLAQGSILGMVEVEDGATVNVFDMIVLGLTGHPQFKPDPEWMSEMTNGAISVADISESVVKLLTLNLIRMKRGVWGVDNEKTALFFRIKNETTVSRLSTHRDISRLIAVDHLKTNSYISAVRTTPVEASKILMKLVEGVNEAMAASKGQPDCRNYLIYGLLNEVTKT